MTVQNWKPLTVSVLFFALSCERIFIETHSIGSSCYGTGKYIVCRRVRASFSPEILQAWAAAKGLSVCRAINCFSLFVSNSNTQAALHAKKQSTYQQFVLLVCWATQLPVCQENSSSWFAGPHSYLSARKLVLFVRWAIQLPVCQKNSSSWSAGVGTVPVG